MWDPRQKDLPVATMEPEPGQDRRDCWTVAFGKVYVILLIFFKIQKSKLLTLITIVVWIRKAVCTPVIN